MKTGDCVQLKTGGCLMTIEEGMPSDFPKRFACVWFNDKGELQRGQFQKDSLQQWQLVDQENANGKSE